MARLSQSLAGTADRSLLWSAVSSANQPKHDCALAHSTYRRTSPSALQAVRLARVHQTRRATKCRQTYLYMSSILSGAFRPALLFSDQQSGP